MFVPETQRRWDATGFVGWRGVDKSDLAPDWNDWYDVAAFSGSAGRYLTPHVKIEVDLSTTSNGRVFSETFFAPPPVPPAPPRPPFPAPPFYTPPSYTLREHEFRRTTVGATLAYQFLENRWVHPFLGVGVEGVREAEQLQTQFVPGGGPRGSAPDSRDSCAVLGPAIRDRRLQVLRVGTRVHSHRRADHLSSNGAESGVWRIGVGVDF